MQMRSSAYWLFACLAVVALAGSPMMAAERFDDTDTCVKQSGDVAIAACSRTIVSGEFRGAELAPFYVARGLHYKDNRDLDRAIADFDQAIRVDPKDAVAYAVRGMAWRAKGDLDRAIADLDQATRLDPKDAGAYTARGIAWDNKGDLDRAIEDFDEAIRLDPERAGAYIFRGMAWQSKGDLDRGIEDLDQAIRLDPKDAGAYGNRGTAWRAKGDLDRAIADYDEAIRLDPKNAFWYFNRGVGNLYAGALPKALADLNQASELQPRNPNTALWLDIVNKRSNLPSRLAEAAKRINMRWWPAPVIRLYLGELTPEALLAEADHPNLRAKHARTCVANFYIGELALQQGKADEAKRLFPLAAAGCSKDYTEYAAAIAELKVLGARP
jgi:lipoprotein NlpI